MKTKIRIQFGNDTPANRVADFATYLHKANILAAVHMDDEYEDLVEIVFNMEGDLKSQYTWVAAGLSKWYGWEFVGPECPRKHHVQHKSETRNMLNSRLPRWGREKWTCLDLNCRKSNKEPMVQDRTDDVMTHREFSMMAHLTMGDPGPVARLPTRVAVDTETTGRSPYSLKSMSHLMMGMDVASEKHWGERYRKIDWNKPNPVGQIPREPDVNKISRTLLDADFQSVEYATLFYQLGLRDPRLLHISRAETYEYAGGWIDGGGVLLVNSDTSWNALQQVLSAWSKANHPKDGVQLAIFEVDDQNLSQEILDKLKTASKQFATVSDNRMRVARQQAKNFSFSGEHLTGKVVSQEEAGQIYQEVLKMFPAIGNYYGSQALKLANDQIAMLQAKVDVLEEEIDNCDEIKKFQNEKVTKLEKELEDWDKATLLPKSVEPAMDKMLRFLANLNMQDHSIAEQREFNERFKELKDSYKEIQEQLPDEDQKAVDV